MVPRLWSAGEIAAAIDLERLWAELGDELSFTRCCAYPSQMADGAIGSAVLQRLYDLHDEGVCAPAPGSGGTVDEIRATAEFCANWSAPGTARRWARSVLGRWSLANDDLLDDGSLVVTELANNAVLHARSTFSVDVRSQADVVRISVRDASLSMPSVAAPGVMDRFGRGLGIVAALATSWGVDADAEGKVVWAQLAGDPVP
jgi:anti-sigma regulatory factor (Ser/Thr protein kinase)